MSTPKTITIDATGAMAGINLATYLGEYYAGLSTAGTSTYYGGTPDIAFGQTTYQNGPQVGFRFGENDPDKRQILITGEDLAYDFIRYGQATGQGISGTIQSVTFGHYDASTLPSDGPGGHGELQGVIPELVVSGLDIAAVPGSGNNPANPVYALYSALRLNGGALQLDKAGLLDLIDATFDGYAQVITGSASGDVLDGGAFDDVIDGGDGADTFVLSGKRAHYDIVQNGDGSYTITDLRAGSAQGTDTVKNVEAFTFADGDVAAANLEGSGQKTITIDASGSSGIDFEAFIRGGFTTDVEAGGMPVFDNQSGVFSGTEMFIGYGADAASKYVLARGDLQYFFGTHTVAGEIGTIEYGTRGAGAYDASGAFVGGNALLRITGLDLSNAVPATPAEETEIEANGPVHNFALAYMYGSSASPEHHATFANALDAYAQNFVGSAGSDVFGGGSLDDDISGMAGNDLLHASLGDDTIDGGADTDIVVFTGNLDDYTLAEAPNGAFTVTRKNGNGATLVKNAEFARFDDLQVNLLTGEETVVGGAPTDVELSAATVEENAAAGTEIGVLSAVDPEGKAVSFSLSHNPGGLFEIVGGALRLKAALDFELKPSYAITVDAIDADGGKTSQDFTITVTNVDEAPAAFFLSKTSIVETAEVGTRVGILSAVDPEGGPVTFKLTGNPGGAFKLDAGGKLTLAKTLDFEKAQSRTVTVTATDGSGLTTTQKITIDVIDTLEAKSGTGRNDVLKGSIGMDKLTGGAGIDKLYGGVGGDKLYGGSGNDRLTGGAGPDDLWGGSGADTFIFRSVKESSAAASGRDSIFDFSARQKDRIDLSAIDANTQKGGNQAFAFIGTKEFSGKAGQLRYEKAKSDTYVQGDVNGDKLADFTIHLDDRLTFSKGYFIL